MYPYRSESGGLTGQGRRDACLQGGEGCLFVEEYKGISLLSCDFVGLAELSSQYCNTVRTRVLWIHEYNKKKTKKKKARTCDAARRPKERARDRRG